jgi:hypothetical protein
MPLLVVKSIWFNYDVNILLCGSGASGKISLVYCLQVQHVALSPTRDYQCRNLSLGFVTKARVCKVMNQKWSLGVTFHAPRRLGIWESVKIEPPHYQMDSQLWELEFQWTPKSSGSDCRGQNPLDWGALYIIEKLLELRCLKWACMTHLDIWNTSYGQKKGR